METSRLTKFCHCCGSSLQTNFKFCPQCGEVVVTRNEDQSSLAVALRSNENQTTAANTSTSSLGLTSVLTTTRVAPAKKLGTTSLGSFSAFKNGKEKERSSYFVRKKGSKRSKVANNDVKITIAIMEDTKKMKRGDSLPLKVPASSTANDILNAAVEKHAAFNKRFNSKLKYLLVFKDGTEANTVPGTNPPEPFTLCRYKEISGFGYSQIRLCLVPLVNKRLNDLRCVIEESDSDESDESLLPSALTEEELVQHQVSALPTTSGPSTSSVVTKPLPDPSVPSTSSSCCDMPPTTSSSIMKVECPLCFHSFPIDQVEQHANGCLGSFGLVEENTCIAECCIGNDNADAEILAEEFATDNSTLAKCINNLKDNAIKSEMEMVRITVRRKMVWEDFKRARYRYYQPDRVLKVTFAGEPAVDDGGPKREFFAGRIFVVQCFFLVETLHWVGQVFEKEGLEG